MSPKLKCHRNWNTTKTKMSPKLKCHLNWNITKTEMFPKLKCYQIKKYPQNKNLKPKQMPGNWPWSPCSCSFCFSKSRENRCLNVCHSSQRTESKNMFTPNCSNYEPIWTDITSQTVTLGANLFVKAQTIPQNVKCTLFFLPKDAFTKDI